MTKKDGYKFPGVRKLSVKESRKAARQRRRHESMKSTAGEHLANIYRPREKMGRILVFRGAIKLTIQAN